MGYVLFVATLGLRLSVILLGGLAPVAAEPLWRRRDSRLRAAEVDQLAAGSPLEAAVLSLRLEQIVRQDLPAWANPLELQGQPSWERFCWLLESIRDLAARCAELDPTSSVELILLMEELLDLARHQVLLLQQGSRAPTESGRLMSAIRADSSGGQRLRRGDKRRTTAAGAAHQGSGGGELDGARLADLRRRFPRALVLRCEDGAPL